MIKQDESKVLHLFISKLRSSSHTSKSSYIVLYARLDRNEDYFFSIRTPSAEGFCLASDASPLISSSVIE